MPVWSQSFQFRSGGSADDYRISLKPRVGRHDLQIVLPKKDVRIEE